MVQKMGPFFSDNMISGPGAAQEHDGRCVSNCAWEDQLWEQQEQLEREMVEARRMVSSLQVTCIAHILYVFRPK